MFVKMLGEKKKAKKFCMQSDFTCIREIHIRKKNRLNEIKY